MSSDRNGNCADGARGRGAAGRSEGPVEDGEWLDRVEAERWPSRASVPIGVARGAADAVELHGGRGAAIPGQTSELARATSPSQRADGFTVRSKVSRSTAMSPKVLA